ncbi:uncharacterized protein MYCFIDRAFT_213435 [Pseudocercospora fijiensis CIRAD86]|uniref:HMG box domain-containing protein n=1 Tax=Pseudocercospora fijiensis (strain CIRAD86) TaxID=383855 RepID=N1Q7W1_PSEFD|nr:uncharacterized protein MYCFIDRAFT_213435 [Pseudocercospora fijiensis CIRAD86]EME88870.1 hypothetical protein MYCFIDRAFT_213435 [Pseudocercospora fijiensis CIRAD86]
MLGRVLVRFPARLPRSLPLLQPNHGLKPKISIILPIRTYATPGRPKSVVGEPSRPVKRNVKKGAAKPRDASSAASKKLASKKLASKKRTTTRAKTPEQKAAQAEKQAAQKAALAKRKAAQKAASQATAEKEKLQELKKAALDPPKQKTGVNAYITFFAEKAAGSSVSDKVNFAERSKNIGAEWKNISATDREHYNHLSHTKAAEQQATFKRWVESHTPTQIQKANEARAQLRRKLPSQKHKWAKIPDERVPKRPTGSFAQFNTNRRHSGDFQGISLSDSTKLLAQEWKALSPSEKEKYEKIYKDDLQRYVSEYSTVFGHPPANSGASEATAAA